MSSAQLISPPQSFPDYSFELPAFMLSTADDSHTSIESPPEELKEKKKRKSAPKSKLGCVTCKERHVKCDEARPGCNRCAKIGHVCGGYIETTRKKSPIHRPRLSPKTTSSPQSSASSFTMSPVLSDFLGDHLSTQEAQSLEYFRTKAAMTFPGPFDSEFWTSILSQASRQEPCVRYAMLAVSSMHRHFSMAAQYGESPSVILSKPPVTLQYYNQAITALRDRVATGTLSTSITLMCCTLFIALATIQGDSDAFIGHVKNGQTVIMRWRAKQTSSYGKFQSTSAYNDDCLIEQHLVPLLAQQDAFANRFLNQNLCSEVFIHEDGSLFNSNLHIPESFRTLEEAQDSLVQINEVILQFNNFNYSSKHSVLYSFTDIADLQRLQNKLQSWRTSFNNFRASLTSTLELNQFTSLVLEVRYCVTRIWLATASTPEYSAFDDLFDTYRSILDLAPLVFGTQTKIDDTFDNQHNAKWGVAFVPQLVFTAMLCRDPAIRREALNLLRCCVHQHVMLAEPALPIVAQTEPWGEKEDFQILGDLSMPLYDVDPLLDMIGPPCIPSDLVLEDFTRLSPEHADVHFSRPVPSEFDGSCGKTMNLISKPWGPCEPWFTENVFV